MHEDQQPTPAPENPGTEQHEAAQPAESSTGSAIGIIIIIVLLILGALYFIGKDNTGEEMSDTDPLQEYEAMDDVQTENDADMADEFDTIDAEVEGQMETELDLETQ